MASLGPVGGVMLVATSGGLDAIMALENVFFASTQPFRVMVGASLRAERQGTNSKVAISLAEF